MVWSFLLGYWFPSLGTAALSSPICLPEPLCASGPSHIPGKKGSELLQPTRQATGQQACHPADHATCESDRRTAIDPPVDLSQDPAIQSNGDPSVNPSFDPGSEQAFNPGSEQARESHDNPTFDEQVFQYAEDTSLLRIFQASQSNHSPPVITTGSPSFGPFKRGTTRGILTASGSETVRAMG